MNILIINSAKEWGGTEKWAVNTAICLAERGHTVYFGCRGDLYDNRFGSDSKVTIVKFPFANNLDIVSVMRLYAFMRKKRIDVVMPTKQREYFLAGLAAKLGTRTKVAGMFAIDRPIHNLRNWIVFCKLFDIVFVNAKKIIGILAQTKAFDIRKCRVVYMGVEAIGCSAEVRKKCRAALGLAENDIAIIAIGRICPQKGFDYAIQAVGQLARQYPQVKLLIVGSGDDASCRQLAAAEGVSDRVIFTGFRSDVPDLVQASDIFWLTSRSEGIPNTMLEAMAAKIPVVAFDIAGVGEIVQDTKNGFLVPFEDLPKLIACTVDLIRDPQLRQRIGENGCRTVMSDYSIEKMCRDSERYLKELVEER